MLRAIIDATAIGDNTILSADSTSGFLIKQLFFVVGGIVNIRFKEGTTSISGLIPLQSGADLFLELNDFNIPWFIITKNNAFIINLSAAVQVGGVVYYEKISL